MVEQSTLTICPSPNTKKKAKPSEEADIADDHPEPVQLLDWLKDRGENLVDVNLVGERKEVQPVFSSVSLSVKLRQELLIFGKS